MKMKMKNDKHVEKCKSCFDFLMKYLEILKIMNLCFRVAKECC